MTVSIGEAQHNGIMPIAFSLVRVILISLSRDTLKICLTNLHVLSPLVVSVPGRERETVLVDPLRSPVGVPGN